MSNPTKLLAYSLISIALASGSSNSTDHIKTEPKGSWCREHANISYHFDCNNRSISSCESGGDSDYDYFIIVDGTCVNPDSQEKCRFHDAFVTRENYCGGYGDVNCTSCYAKFNFGSYGFFPNCGMNEHPSLEIQCEPQGCIPGCKSMSELKHQVHTKFNPVYDNLVIFSSSSTSDIRLTLDGLPCQGVLLSTANVYTAPACAKKISEQLGYGDRIKLLDNHFQTIGMVKAANSDEAGRGIISISLSDTENQNRAFPVMTEKLLNNGKYQAHYFRPGEAYSIGRTSVFLSDAGLQAGLRRLQANDMLPPGSPVTYGNHTLVCIADGGGLCTNPTTPLNSIECGGSRIGDLCDNDCAPHLKCSGFSQTAAQCMAAECDGEQSCVILAVDSAMCGRGCMLGYRDGHIIRNGYCQ